MVLVGRGRPLRLLRLLPWRRPLLLLLQIGETLVRWRSHHVLLLVMGWGWRRLPESGTNLVGTILLHVMLRWKLLLLLRIVRGLGRGGR